MNLAWCRARRSCPPQSATPTTSPTRLKKTREYCERQLCKRGMPRNSTNAYVTWRNMTTLADGRVSHDIFIDFRIITIGNKTVARKVVDVLVPDEEKIPNDTRDLMGM